jgi:hypothetical protein
MESRSDDGSTKSLTVRTLDDTLLVFEDRDLASAVIRQLAEQEEVQLGVESEYGGQQWIAAALPDGLSGYVLGSSALSHTTLCGEIRPGLPLTPNVAKAVERLFSGENRAIAHRLLAEECAQNLPNCGHSNEYELEDLRFEVLKLSEGNIIKLRDAVQLANQDWRELAVAAGSVREYKLQLLGNDLVKNPKKPDPDRTFNNLTALVAFVMCLSLRLLDVSGGKVIGAMTLLAISYVARYLILPRTRGDFLTVSAMSYGLLSLMFVWVPALLGLWTGYVIMTYFLRL